MTRRMWAAASLFAIGFSATMVPPARAQTTEGNAVASESTSSKVSHHETKRTNEAVDSLGLAAVLIGGKDFERAKEVLNTIDPTVASSDPSFSLSRYHKLRGLAALMTGDYPAATRSLRKARAEQESAIERRRLSVVLAKALAGQDQWRQCLVALEQANELGRADPSLFLLRANAHRRLGEVGRALRTFRVGANHFPEDRRMKMGESFLLVEQGLHQEALATAREWLAQGTEEDRLRFAAALLAAGESALATELGEETLLLFPTSSKTRVLLAHAAAGAAAYSTAAHHFERAALLSDDDNLLADAAEMYRRANRPDVALRLGTRIPDARRKARQRVGIFMEQERFAEAVTMQPRLERLELLDDDMRMALAYAWMVQAASTASRDAPLERASTLLDGVESRRAFRQAVSMREAIEACRKESSRCP